MLSEHLPEFLFRRTNGVIGTLTRYIAEAGVSVIGRSMRDGGENLTEADFLRIRLDHAAEDEDAEDEGTVRPSKRSTKRRSNSLYSGARREGAA